MLLNAFVVSYTYEIADWSVHLCQVKSNAGRKNRVSGGGIVELLKEVSVLRENEVHLYGMIACGSSPLQGVPLCDCCLVGEPRGLGSTGPDDGPSPGY